MIEPKDLPLTVCVRTATAELVDSQCVTRVFGNHLGVHTCGTCLSREGFSWDKSCWVSSVAATSHSAPCQRVLRARRWLLVVVHETPLALASVRRSIFNITSVLIWCVVRELRVAWLPEVVRQLRAFKPSAGCTLFLAIPHTKTRHFFALPFIGV